MARPKPKKWTPQNPDKYIGNVDNIISRSSWESKAMSFLDGNTSVLAWASEEFSIKYVSPLDNKVHRYFCDFLAKIQSKNGDIKMYLLEVKPHAERFIPTTKNKKLFLTQMQTYLVNQAKWKAAEEFCKLKNIIFLVLDEYDMGIKKRPK